MASLCPPIKIQQFTNTGALAVGYKLYTYDTGTTNAAATYTDSGAGASNTNPIILDARGEATVFLAPGHLYRFVLKTDADVTVWTQDGVGSSVHTAGDGVTISSSGVVDVVAGLGISVTTDVAIDTAVVPQLAEDNAFTGVNAFDDDISVNGDANVSTLTFGVTGNSLSKVISVTDTRDVGSLSAQAGANFSVTVTGAAAGDHVVLTPLGDYATNTGLYFKGVASLNTVTVYYFNASSGAINPGSSDLQILVFRTV